MDQSDPQYEHHHLEALWVTWGLNRVDESLLRRLLKSEDYRARAAAVRVLRYSGHQIADQPELLMQAVQDDHGRVRLEAIVAASWLSEDLGLPILAEASKKPIDEWIQDTYKAAIAHIKGESVLEERRPEFFG